MSKRSGETLSIGVLGAGPVTQAIHLPVLASLRDEWRVAKVMDVNLTVARAVADRCGALATEDADAVIDDPSVDVIAVCSPNAFHASQVIAACRAGKRAILCEKPLATSREEAQAIAAAAAASQTVILVGTMHLFDPAFRAALTAFQSRGRTAHHVKSAIYLPPNGQLVGLATEEVVPSAPPPPTVSVPTAQEQRQRIKQTILGLAIHHLPLVRRLYPSIGEVLAAQRLPPFGYSILLRNGEQVAELLAFMPGQWQSSWTFEATADRHVLSVEFPPSYVAAGSSRAQLIDAASTTQFHFSMSGYEAQWRHLFDVLVRGTRPFETLEDAIGDLSFALDLADRTAAVMEIVT
jgi:predicted dehydrogenase